MNLPRSTYYARSDPTSQQEREQLESQTRSEIEAILAEFPAYGYRMLGKSDVLSEDERELMKVHTIMGDSMAAQLDFPEQVRPVVRSHHEQWARGGYPDRLVGEEIPLNARIVSIADVYDALTSPRSFRSAYSREEALQIMEKDAVKMFDPNIFGIFRDMLKRGELEM